MIGDPNVIIGCLPSEVLAPSPGTKSLDGNFSVGDGTSKFWWKMYFTRKDTVHTCILKKNSGPFFLSWIFLIVYRNPEAPQKYIPVTHSLGPGSDCVRPGETESWREASLGFAHHFSSPQEEGSEQCSLFCWCPVWQLEQNENDECMVCMQIIYSRYYGGQVYFPNLVVLEYISAKWA